MSQRDSWNLPPPEHFQGLRADLPLQVYVRHLPHWRQPHATYFVTFRLADSLPASKLQELDHLKWEWERDHSGTKDHRSLEQLAQMVSQRIELWLDQGMGSCVLRESTYSLLVHQALQYFHQQRYELGASVVMPNHVHCIVRPFSSEDTELEEITGSWKSFTARRINAAMGQSGKFWQDESFDRIIRDEEHLWRCLQYLGANPRRASLTDSDCRLWVNPDWANIGWKFIT